MTTNHHSSYEEHSQRVLAAIALAPLQGRRFQPASYANQECTLTELRSHSSAPASPLAALRLAYIASGYARSPRLASAAQ